MGLISTFIEASGLRSCGLDFDSIEDDLYASLNYIEEGGKHYEVIDSIKIAEIDIEGTYICLTPEGVEFLKPIVFKYMIDNLNDYITELK